MNNATTLLMDDLSHLKGKPADHVTHFLKKCAGGTESTMIDGLINIIGILDADKKHSVRNAKIGGIAIGIISTVVISSSAHWIHRYHEKCQNRKKVQDITEILKQEVALANQEEISADKNDIIREVSAS